MSNDIKEVLVGVPSLGPQMCMMLWNIGENLKAKASKESNSEVKDKLLDFADAIGRVCAYSLLHQKGASEDRDKSTIDFTKLITIEEVSKLYGIKQEKIMEWVNACLCPYYLLAGEGPLFKKMEIKKWISDNKIIKCNGKPILTLQKILTRSADKFNIYLPNALKAIKGLCIFTFEAAISGIYFLCVNDEVVYIGSSENIHTRILVHTNGSSRMLELKKEYGKEITAAYYLPVVSSEMRRLEDEFIQIIQPKLNRTIKEISVS